MNYFETISKASLNYQNHECDHSGNYLEFLYLDYFNNFLTVERFAQYYGITKQMADNVIKLGKEVNHKKKETANA